MNGFEMWLRRRPLDGLTALAAVVRLAAVTPTLNSTPFTDMQEYVDRANYLVRNHTFVPDAFRTPLYPLFIASVFEAGGGLATVRVLQALIGAAAVPLTYKIARAGVPERPSLLAAVLVAIYPAWILYPGYILSENLFAPLLLLGFAMWSKDTPGSACAAGLTIGLASLTRAVGVTALAGIVIASIVERVATGRLPHRTLLRLLLLTAVFVVTLAPWTIRNAQMFKRLIPLDTNTGYNFLVGNNPQATGRLEADDWNRIEARYWHAGQSDVERSDTSIREAWRYIRSRPRLTLARLPWKAAHLGEADWREHAWIYSTGYFGRLPTFLFWPAVGLLWAGFPVLLTAAVFGFTRSYERGGAFWPITITLCFVVVGHVFTFGESRFHLPWVGLLAAIAAFGFDSNVPDARRRTPGSMISVAVVLIALVAMWTRQVQVMQEQARVLASAPRLPIPWTY